MSITQVSCYRIVHQRFLDTNFSGKGASDHGGRWNTKGTPVVYLASSCALASLEILIHVDNPKHLQSFYSARIDIPSNQIEELPTGWLPRDWNASGNAALKEFGDRWVASGRKAFLRVPSAAYALDGEPGPEFNVLANPNHPSFKLATIHSPALLTLHPNLAPRAPISAGR